MNDVVVETYHLTKIYGKVHAVSGLTVKIPRGVFGLIGLNGAGKTTLLTMLVGLRQPTTGTASVLGFDIGNESFEIRQHIGVLNEQLGFFDNVPALDQLILAGRTKGLNRQEARIAAQSWLEKIGLSKMEKAKVGSFSAGMKQRLGLAQALLNEPKLIILDEPTVNLDPLGRELMFSILEEEVKKGASVIASSHLLFELERICTIYGIMHKGTIVKTIEASEIKLLAQKKYIVECDNKEKLFEILKEVNWISSANLTQRGIVIEIDDVNVLWDTLPKLAKEKGVLLTSVEPIKDVLVGLLKSIQDELE